MEFLKNNKEVLLFLGKLSALCAFYFLWFSPNVWQLPIISTIYGYYIHYTLLYLVEPSVWILRLLGYGADVVNLRNIDLHDVAFNIHVKNFCLGTDMMFSLTALIVSFPGKWIDRLWFIPLGLLGIQLINIGRIVGMCLSYLLLKRGEFADHHDVFNIIAVIFIFFMFTIWVKRFEKEPAR